MSAVGKESGVGQKNFVFAFKTSFEGPGSTTFFAPFTKLEFFCCFGYANALVGPSAIRSALSCALSLARRLSTSTESVISPDSTSS